MEAERKRRIAAARETLLSKAESDMQPLAPLLTGPMTPATKRALQTYLSRYRSAKITVDGTTESVTIPGVSRIDRALSAETARDKAALALAQKQKLDEEKQALLARAAKDFASIAPLLEGEVPKEVRPVLEAFVARYEGAKITVDDVEQTVVIPGVAKTQQALGGALSGDTNSIGMKFVRIEAGSFAMGCTAEQGSDCWDNEKPAHNVTLSRSFYMQTTEVTQGQWRAVMGSNPSHFSRCGDTCPVEKVSWDDAVAFAQKLSVKEGLRGGSVYRLPTEAEWEYAARAGQGTKYAGSNSLDAVAWHSGNSGGKTHPVGQKSPNAWGLYDMSGNVYEWTADWYGGYSSGNTTNPEGASSGSCRVLRGGSWISAAAFARVANRDLYLPVHRDDFLGFRLVRTIP